MAPTNTGRTRQAFSLVNKQDISAASDMSSTEGSESGNVEFTKEEAEALLNEKSKAKKFDLKVCLKPFVGRLICVFGFLFLIFFNFCCDELVGQNGANDRAQQKAQALCQMVFES